MLLYCVFDVFFSWICFYTYRRTFIEEFAMILTAGILNAVGKTLLRHKLL